METHRQRTEALQRGASLSEVTASLVDDFGIAQEIVPMSDEPVRTFVEVQTCGAPYWLPFQEYFVRERCKPRVCRVRYEGSSHAQPAPRVRTLLESGDIHGIVICPSNPYLSIDPILAVPGMAGLLRSCGVPIVAVSPIVGGRSLKGPTSKIMEELGTECGVGEIADHYGGLLDGLVVDTQDQEAIGAIEARGMRAMATNTVMSTLDDRQQLARDVLDFIGELAEATGHVGHRTG
jgi:LPPG:FO 2-phospho-L-lactate transferase